MDLNSTSMVGIIPLWFRRHSQTGVFNVIMTFGGGGALASYQGSFLLLALTGYSGT